MQLICGIDPGLDGAIGFLNQDGTFAHVADMPTLPTSTGRRQVDPAALAGILKQHRPVHVIVERVGARPGEGATGAFSFGHSFGVIAGVLGALGIPHSIVQPAVWKRCAGIPPGASKAASITTAKCAIPSAAEHLTLVKHHGRAEALLLARHAKLSPTNL